MNQELEGVATIRGGKGRKFVLIPQISKNPVRVMLKDMSNIIRLRRSEIMELQNADGGVSLENEDLLIVYVPEGTTAVTANSMVGVVTEDGGEAVMLFLNELNIVAHEKVWDNSTQRVVMALNQVLLAKRVTTVAA